VPIVVISTSLRGLIEAAQRFDIVNMVKIPGSILVFILPIVGIFLGYNLPGIITLIMLSRIAVAFLYLFFSFKIFEQLRRTLLVSKGILKSLFNFGVWVTICNILIPILVSLDRFVIGHIISMSAVAYYTAPSEVVWKLLIVPGIIATTVFPSFSFLAGVDTKRLENLYARTLKYIIIVLGPVSIIAVLFANEILSLWLGKDFALHSFRVFQILAIGMFLNSLAQMPANLLDGIGKPDLRAKIFILYTPIYVCLLWILTHGYGIDGTAMAWTLRAGLELFLFFVITAKILNIKIPAFLENGLTKSLKAFALYGIFSLATLPIKEPILKIILISVLLISFIIYIWKDVFDIEEKSFLVKIIMRHS
ncbi:MAG: oligosaccharide flippase family protein, partial [Nitrososphaeria archaeon]